MATRKHALIDLVMNDEVARYVGILQSQLYKLIEENTRQRALLELLTDESWDTYNFTDESGELRRIATDALERRLGFTPADARKEVARRMKAHNERPDGIDVSTFLIGPQPEVEVVPEARRIDTPETAVPYNYQKHLQGLETAAKNREAMRLQVE